MKILFTRFPLESLLGGTEVQTISLMEGLIKKGHAVAFLGSCPVILALCRERNIPAIELNIGNPPVTKTSLFTFSWRQWKMRNKLRETVSAFSDLSAVVMLSMSEKLLLTPYLTKQGIPAFWVEHDRVGPWLTKSPLRHILRTKSKDVTTIVVSELSREIYLKLGWHPNSLVTIPNGIDLQRFSNVLPKVQSAKDTLHIGCIARLVWEKGVDVLIKAMAGKPNIRLTIVGSGRGEEEARALIAHTLKNEEDKNRIRLLMNMGDLSEFYSSIDVFVLPSRDHDPFGLVAIEAMSIGIPTIVTNACGVASYLMNGETGIVVKAGNSMSLREGILSLENRQKRARIAMLGRAYALEHFALATMITRYEQLFLHPRTLLKNAALSANGEKTVKSI